MALKTADAVPVSFVSPVSFDRSPGHGKAA